MNDKYDFSDVTFLIPVRVDSLYRLENLQLCIHFLQRYFHTSIKVLEANKYNNHLIEHLCRGIEYLFVKDMDDVYHRTKYQNLLVENVQTPYISIWEADILAYPERMVEALEQLRAGKAEVAYPYNGMALDTSFLLREYYAKTRDLSVLQKNTRLMNAMYDKTDLPGGAIFYNKEAYIKGGKDDERFYGWGNEDYERHLRWQTLGYRIFRADSVIFHLSHTRGDNSRYISEYHHDYSIRMLTEVQNSSCEELLVNKE